MQASWIYFITQWLFYTWQLLRFSFHNVEDLSSNHCFLQGQGTLAAIQGCETGKGRQLVKGVFLHQLPQWTEMILAGIPPKRLENTCLHIMPAMGCWNCGIYNPIPVGHLLRATLVGCKWGVLTGTIFQVLLGKWILAILPNTLSVFRTYLQVMRRT